MADGECCRMIARGRDQMWFGQRRGRKQRIIRAPRLSKYHGKFLVLPLTIKSNPFHPSILSREVCKTSQKARRGTIHWRPSITTTIANCEPPKYAPLFCFWVLWLLRLFYYSTGGYSQKASQVRSFAGCGSARSSPLTSTLTLPFTRVYAGVV